MPSDVAKFIRLQHMAAKAADLPSSASGGLEHAKSYNRMRESILESLPNELKEEFETLFKPLDAPDSIDLAGLGMFEAGNLSSAAKQNFASISGWLEGVVAAEKADL